MKRCDALTAWRSVGNITFGYPSPVRWFPRSYLKGFVVGNFATGTHISGNDLIFEYLSPMWLYSFRINSNFFDWNSNRYNVKGVFDTANCWQYRFGVPVPASINIRFIWYTGDSSWRIHIVVEYPPALSQVADLPPPPSTYWRYPL